MITVVIATYNRSKSLEKCLLSLTQQSDRDFDVLIADGGSSDDTKLVINKYKKKLAISVFIDPKPHLAYIRDQLWRRAKGSIIAAVDDDVVVGAQWMHSIKKALKTSKDVGGVTGPTIIPKRLIKSRDVFALHTTSNGFLQRFARLYFWLFMNGQREEIGKIYPSGAWSPGSNFASSKKVKKPIEVDYLEACNYVIRKDVLKQIRGYDLGYKKTSEWCEVDVSFRIRKAGYKLLFDPSVAVEHRVSTSGVFSRRRFPIHRIANFIRFYHTSYYPKSIVGYLQFLLYLGFVSCYYLLRIL